MQFLYRILVRRAIAFMAMMFVLVVVGLFRGPLTGTKDSGSHNPWSKSYVAPHPSSQSSLAASSSTTHYEYFNKRTGEPATEEELRDEAFRRKMLRDMREHYEQQNGTVDTTDLDN